MKKRVVWVVVSCLMALSLLMASCAPAAVEEEEKAAPPPKVEKEVITEEEVAPPSGEPTYGGEINLASTLSDFNFDDCYGKAHGPPLALTHEKLFIGDWLKGPAGTGEVTWRTAPFNPATETGCLVESWERPDEDTIVFHIRKGVRWQDRPPLNGRELTADDVVYTLNRQFFSDVPQGQGTIEPTAKHIRSIEATDRYTVVIDTPGAYIPTQLRQATELIRIFAPEPGGEYPGDFRDWHTCVGTGPFMVVDYVPGSSVSVVRNPNYWMKDPLHPENTLPYVDAVNVMIIPDASTRQAALRTGKIEVLENLDWEDRDSLLRTNPELKWEGGPSGKGATLVGMRTDRSDLPFQYLTVRRALAMSVDRRTIVKDLYSGNADLFKFPILPGKEFQDMFTPLDEHSESIQELYEYNPEKAKQLLTEAGYPGGFKTTIACTQVNADLASILKAYWEKIGVDLELEVREGGAHMGLKFTHDGMFMGGYPGDDPQVMFPFVTNRLENYSMVSDPYIDDIFYSKLEKYGYLEWDKLCQTLKEEVVPYLLEQCWYIDLPSPYAYTFWQPWLKEYRGEAQIGFRNEVAWLRFVWLDQELKKEKTGR